MTNKTFPLVRKSNDIKMFPTKNFSGKICLSPFVSISIGDDGRIRLCGCYSWMPTAIGNIYDTPLLELLSNDLAKKIRESIVQGGYEYCNEKNCGVIRNDLLNSKESLPDQVKWQIQDSSRVVMPREIYISGDYTCNLSCPSCRTHVIKSTEAEKQQQQALADKMTNNLFSKPTEDVINLTLSTTGELFASAFLLQFVSGISRQNFPNVFLQIQTNGLLCEKNWHKLGGMQDAVKKITVTIDASRDKTYEKLRRGGTWKEIMSAMAWLQAKKKQNGMKLQTRIVVQKDNFQELEEFYYMSKNFDADQVEYARIKNWFTMTDDKFKEVDILHPDHPQYKEAMEVMNRVINLPDVLTWG